MSDTVQDATEAEAGKKKARKAKAEKAPAEPKGPGVISTLVGLLQDGGGTVDELGAELAKRFPDRAADGMKTTIRVQLVRLAKTGKLNIAKEKVEGRGLVYTGSTPD